MTDIDELVALFSPLPSLLRGGFVFPGIAGQPVDRKEKKIIV